MGHAELGGSAVVPPQVADASRRGGGRGVEAEFVVAEGERGGCLELFNVGCCFMHLEESTLC